MTPDFIFDNWTDELLDLMVEKLAERKQREKEAVESASSGRRRPNASVDTLAARAPHLINVVKGKT